MPKCSCAGSSCACLIVGLNGGGVNVSGTGTAADPYVLSVAASGLNIGGAIAVSDTATIDLTKNGSGSVGDPVILQGAVIFSGIGLKSSFDSTWLVPTLTNSWQNPTQSTYPAVSYRRTSSGFVTLRGLIRTPASGTGATVAFVLPAGYRPTGGTRVYTAIGSGTTVARVEVDVNGNVTITSAATNTDLTLDGVRFYLD